VIVDDVVTTTSTVNELAHVLKKAGVKRVDVWSIARAV
jgi:predicted amidophosphoribosyltransferase